MDVQCSALTSHNLQVGWLPPAPHLAHGVIQGYRLLYESADDDSLSETTTRESKAMTSTNTVLHGLLPAANYSVQVLAFTRAGDGVPSQVIVCRTEEAGRLTTGRGLSSLGSACDCQGRPARHTPVRGACLPPRRYRCIRLNSWKHPINARNF